MKARLESGEYLEGAMSQPKGAQQATQPAREPDQPARGTPALQPQVQDHIGRQRRAVYDDILQQPVPDRFKELMDKLDRLTGDAE